MQAERNIACIIQGGMIVASMNYLDNRSKNLSERVDD